LHEITLVKHLKSQIGSVTDSAHTIKISFQPEEGTKTYLFWSQNNLATTQRTLATTKQHSTTTQNIWAMLWQSATAW